MKFIFDECVSLHIANVLVELGEDVTHIVKEFGRGKKDIEFLPLIGANKWVLITLDKKMNSPSGKHGHRAILEEHNVLYLQLPQQFSSWGTIKSCAWILTHWGSDSK